MLIVLKILKTILPPVLFAEFVTVIGSALFGHSLEFFVCGLFGYYVLKAVRKRGGADTIKHTLCKGGVSNCLSSSVM